MAIKRAADTEPDHCAKRKCPCKQTSYKVLSEMLDYHNFKNPAADITEVGTYATMKEAVAAAKAEMFQYGSGGPEYFDDFEATQPDAAGEYDAYQVSGTHPEGEEQTVWVEECAPVIFDGAGQQAPCKQIRYKVISQFTDYHMDPDAAPEDTTIGVYATMAEAVAAAKEEMFQDMGPDEWEDFEEAEPDADGEYDEYEVKGNHPEGEEQRVWVEACAPVRFDKLEREEEESEEDEDDEDEDDDGEGEDDGEDDDEDEE